MKKSKLFKTISFSSLALLMGIAGTMAFAPLGASPNNLANASESETTTEQGLITPKKDDPVIYTTESGIEIKWGNAAPATTNPSLSSGNLAGFPYFTTTSGSTTYTWVIIGRNSNVTTINSAVQSYLFSTWKANNSTSNEWVLGNHFFENTYETTTPAGSAINGVVPSKSYVNDNVSFSISDITTNDDEIPSGCVLALSNASVGTSAYSTHAGGNYSYTQGFGGSENTLTTLCKKYYTDDTFGFNDCLSAIKPQTVTQRVSLWSSANLYSTNSASMHFFPLGHDATYDNFRFSTYLTADQVKLSVNVVLRTMLNHASVYYINTSGVATANTATNPYPYNHQSTWHVRPACVISVV